MGSSSMTAARLQVNDGLGNRVVMLDKPLVLLTALRALLALWPVGSAGGTGS